MNRASRATGDELQVLIDELADELGRSVVIDDPAVRMLCASRHFGDEDDLRVRAVLQRDAGPEVSAYVLGQGVARWARPGTIKGRADLGMRARLCVPLRERGELLGLLMVIEAERALTADQLARIEAGAKTASALLYRRRIAENGPRAEQEQALSRLLSTDSMVRSEALRTTTAHDGSGAIVAVLRVQATTVPAAEVEVALRSVLESAARRQPHKLRTAVHGNQGIALWSAAPTDLLEVREQAERRVAGAERLLAVLGAVVAGVGDHVDSLAEAWRSGQQAHVAARGALRI
ncbi:MAG: hypothetical protein ABW215_12005, partial [Kibdelosporangium sp.]